MATWVGETEITSKYYSKCKYKMSGGYGTVSRSGNTVSFAFGVRVKRTTGSYTTNAHGFRYPNSTSGKQYYGRSGSGSSGTWYYTSSTTKGSYTTEATPYSYSGDVSSGASGSVTVTVGWTDSYATPSAGSGTWTAFSFSVPYGAAVYTNTISHWTWGYKNGEGNNGAKNAYHLGDTTFTGNYNATVSMGTGRGVTVPNGFTLRNTYGSGWSGEWKSYDINATFPQGSGAKSFEYDYDPVSYTITYTMNGGTNSSSNPSSYNVLYGVTFANPSRTGYTFKNWTIGGTAATGINVGANATFTSVDDLRTKCSQRTTGNKTVVANWTANTYKITFDKQSGSGGTDTVNITYDTPQGSYPSITLPTRTGYTFGGYYTGTGGGGTQYYDANGNSVRAWQLASNTTLYAKWTINKYYFDVNPAGGIASFDIAGVVSPGTNLTDYYQQNDYGTVGTLSNIKAKTGYTYTGYTLSGTLTAESGSTNAKPIVKLGAGAGAIALNSSINSYKVSYNANGGTSTPTTQTANYNTTVQLAAAISKNNTDSNVTITITYNANQGTGAPGNSTGTAVNTTPYTFNKWALNSTSGTTYSAGGDYTIPAADSTMYATWNTGTTTRKSNPSITLSSTIPTRTGYKFLGWATSSTATTINYEAGKAYTFSANTTLYAVWKQDNASIRGKVNGSWVRGPAWIKNNGTWVKATAVWVKVDGVWKKGV